MILFQPERTVAWATFVGLDVFRADARHVDGQGAGAVTWLRVVRSAADDRLAAGKSFKPAELESGPACDDRAGLTSDCPLGRASQRPLRALITTSHSRLGACAKIVAGSALEDSRAPWPCRRAQRHFSAVSLRRATCLVFLNERSLCSVASAALLTTRTYLSNLILSV